MTSGDVHPTGEGIPFQRIWRADSPTVGPVKLPTPASGLGQGCCVSKCGRFAKIPMKLLCDPQWMLFLVLFFGVVTQSLGLAGGSAVSVAPYFSIASSPLYLVHAVRATKKKAELVKAGAKTHNYAEAVFFAILALDATGTAFCHMTKPFAGGVQLAGTSVSHKAACAFIFGHMLPIIMVTAGSVGGVAALATFWRSRSEMKKFKKRVKDQDFQKVAELMEFLQEPTALPKKDFDMKLLNERRKANYFSNDKRRQALEAKIRGHEISYICALRDTPLPKALKAASSEQANDLLHQMQALFCSIFEGEHNLHEQAALLEHAHEKVRACMREQGKLFEGQDTEEFRAALEAQENAIQSIKSEYLRESQELIDEVKAEVHRNLMNLTIMLFLAVLTTVGGGLTLGHMPHERLVGSILVIAGSITAIGGILFEKFVTDKRFLEMDKWLRGKAGLVA